MEKDSSIVTLPTSTGKEVMAEAENISLSMLKPADIDKTLKVKAYRKWTITNKNGKPVMFCCMLIDQQGEAIQANINIRQKPKFDAILNINQTYRITGFGFQPAKPYMQVLPHSLSLVFGDNTDIQQIPDIGFPSHYFRFTQYKDLYSKLDKKDLLTDYVGCVQYVTGIQQVAKPTTEVVEWRDIGIQNLDGLAVRFTLWGDKAHSFSMEEYESSEKPTVIAVSSCLVKDYGGLQLSNTAATKYYFNPDVPETAEIRNVYNELLGPPVIPNVQRLRSADVEQEKQRNRVTLADLLKENPENQKGVRFTVIATIDKIDTNRPWYFKKCLTCKQKISETYQHAQCKQSVSETNPNCSYCFRLLLTDDTGSIYLKCFSNEANSMIKDCNDIIRCLQDKDPYEYPPEIHALQGQTKIFQLHFAPESTKEKRDFILDTAWDDTTLLIAGPTTDTKTVGKSSGTTNATEEMQSQTDTPESELEKKGNILPVVSPSPITATPISVIKASEESPQVIMPPKEIETITDSSTNATASTAITDENKDQRIPATPLEQTTTLSDLSKSKYGPRKTSARRIIFTEQKDEAAPSKRSKKDD